MLSPRATFEIAFLGLAGFALAVAALAPYLAALAKLSSEEARFRSFYVRIATVSAAAWFVLAAVFFAAPMARGSLPAALAYTCGLIAAGLVPLIVVATVRHELGHFLSRDRPRRD